MKNAALLIMLAAAALCPMRAQACTVVQQTPEELVKEHEHVLIAYPIAKSYLPREASHRWYRGRYRETVLWKVVVSWKGKYQPGDQFTTRQRVDGGGMCGGGNRSDEGRSFLLAFNGREPYPGYSLYALEFSPDMFQYFQDKQVKKAKP